jgi:hypothetical protein
MLSKLLAAFVRKLIHGTPSKMSKFTYDRSPLRSPSTSIRLIDLCTSHVDSTKATGATHSSRPLQCRIYSVPLTTLPSYTALSYTWGPPDRTQPIALSDQEFFVTPSLATALQHIRHPDRDNTLWIDQICINQEDGEEKNAQVPLMSQIYSKADEVLIWMGPAADGSDSLMDVWQQVGQEAEVWGLKSYFTKERYPELLQVLAKSDPNDKRTMKFHTICLTAGPRFDIKAMHAWYKRPWFQRVWVVQEFCLGLRTVFLCGKKRVSADNVLLARHIFDFYMAYALDKQSQREKVRYVNAMLTDDPTAPLFTLKERRLRFERNDGTGNKLFYLLQTIYIGNNIRATDPRDKIFGLAALATDTKELVIKPDYLTSTVDQVYTRTARAIIQDGELNLLGLAQFPKVTTSLPTWVPDWCGDIQPSFCSLYPSSRIKLHLFAPSGSDSPSLFSTDDERLLGVEGYLIDKIERVCDPWIGSGNKREFNHEPYLTYLSQVKSLCMISAARNNYIYETSQRRAEGFWRIPIGDIEEETTHDLCRATSSFFKGYQKLFSTCEGFEQSKEPSTLADADEYKDMSTRYRSRMHEMRNKRPYLSKEGYVGMGPVTSTVGDVIAVLLGARVPYVLRPNGEGRFSFLGEAYCDGIMDGEMITKRSKQNFVLV